MAADPSLAGHIAGHVASGLTGAQAAWAVAATSLVFLWLGAVSVLLVVVRFRVQSMHKELAARQAAKDKLAAELEAQALLGRQMSLDLDELRKSLAERADALPATGSGWPGAGVPLNLNRRGQILSLSRKGKSVAEIASDLNVAQGEVELLLKVHDLTQQAAASEN